MQTLTCAFCAVAMISAVTAPGEEPDYKRLYEEQKARNDALERRMIILEQKVAAEYVPTAKVTETTLGFIGKTELSGFVSASYTYNFNDPAGRTNTGRGFGTRANEFMLNKFVLSLEKPVEYNAFDWEAGYSAKLFFGQDAKFTQTDLSLGEAGDLFEANVTVNIPVGNGMKVTLGKYGTPLGYEASFTEENANWSGGNQWALIEPFTHTGLRLTYALSELWEVELFVNNGWDRVADNNNARSFMGHITYTPRDATTISIAGFGGPEQDDDSEHWLRGVNLYLEQKLTPRLKTALQLDYGAEAEDGTDLVAEWLAAGLWFIYEPSKKWSAALRGDYLNDKAGWITSGTLNFPDNEGMELYSLTLTVNFKPVEPLRIAPEIRWDYSTLKDAFDGHNDQVTIGLGAAYSF